MKLSQIKRVAIIGAGIMGHGFAQIFAQKGYPVFLYDIDSAILEKARQRIDANLDTFIENGLLRKKEKGPGFKSDYLHNRFGGRCPQCRFRARSRPGNHGSAKKRSLKSSITLPLPMPSWPPTPRA